MTETAFGDNETELHDDSAPQAESEPAEEKSSKAGSKEPAVGKPQKAEPARFDNFSAAPAAGGGDSDVNLDVILDVGVHMSMEVGRVRIPIRNLLQLSQGSVVELDRLAGEPLDVFVNGTLIAHGEVVMVNDKFGVRLTDVVSPAERIRKLR